MADFTKPTVADMAAGNPGIDMGTSGRMHEIDWDTYWSATYPSCRYSRADRPYEHFRPAYKYGHEASFEYGGRAWDEEVEHDLRRGWEQARGESTCTWDEARDAVKDAYERSRQAT
ncbi:MAG TPA: hypothetical protein VJU87_02475 [Gemmatimonadaceae bacterium]|nr:hypothetical protein [Gemmatimonadaceae bacterium]